MIGRLEVFCDGSRVGTACFNLRRGGISTTFTYEESWLGDETGFALDPALPLVSGAHHTQGLPGSFRDSLPDRWVTSTASSASRTVEGRSRTRGRRRCGEIAISPHFMARNEGKSRLPLTEEAA
ncbi:HipA N-terminal domain-containing protein [Caniella muris]|uniref:HipA N-terminal domain-containing protein n=1 Tax=Caniella muris TaxID=2941502 RepID=UPI003B84A054